MCATGVFFHKLAVIQNGQTITAVNFARKIHFTDQHKTVFPCATNQFFNVIGNYGVGYRFHCGKFFGAMHRCGGVIAIDQEFSAQCTQADL
ncbi:MAG: hypothetical protein AseanaTS_18590 [Candidatus Pelagadaptatus aseana]